MLSLMDGFSSYNKIKVVPEDYIKITFTCPWRNFCWNIMPFGLKNSIATYQCAITTLFYDMMHVYLKDYVDDLLGESYTRKGHLEIMGKSFTRLEKYKL